MRDLVRGGVVQIAALSTHWTVHRATIAAIVPAYAPRILLLRPDHLGDVLLTTPAIAALRAALPHARLTALVGPWAAASLANNPHVDDVVTLRFPGFDRDKPRMGIGAYARLVAAVTRIRRDRYDMAINLRPDFWWGTAVLALAGIPRRVGFDLSPGREALTDVVPAPGRDEHSVSRSLRAVRHAALLLGGEVPLAETVGPGDAPLVFAPTAEDRAWAGACLARVGVAPECSPIVLHPGSGAPVKEWSPHKWAEVLTEMARVYDLPVVVTGAPHERSQVEAVVRMLPANVRATAVVDAMPLGRFGALLARARLVLGVDSGPLHLATAVGTPTVRLYGPTSPDIFGPWGAAGLHLALVSPLSCAPCGQLDYARADLAAHPCVRVITPRAVLAAAHAVLATADAHQSASRGGHPAKSSPSHSGESVGAR